MRYVKGSIVLNSVNDHAVLRHVLRSRHVSHEQLWQFLQLNGQVWPRRTLNWRIQRLVEHGLIIRSDLSVVSGVRVYRISDRGASYLIGKGESAALMIGSKGNSADESAIQHSLDINDIHLAMLRTKQLVSWQCESEIRSQNEFTGVGFAKDYDAIVTVNTNGRDVRFALEYERTPKPPKRYWQIRELIEKEKHVECILYLTSTFHLLSYVSRFFERSVKAVYFGILDEFRLHNLETKVMDSRRTVTFPLSSVLQGRTR
jgi:hypothetical protein